MVVVVVLRGVASSKGPSITECYHSPRPIAMDVIPFKVDQDTAQECTGREDPECRRFFDEFVECRRLLAMNE